MNSDIVFGLFAICGYQFSPRIADISDASCGGRTPQPTTARSSPSRTTPSVWTASAPTGATCSAWPAP
ncbi:Tn3 family transposase [Streptomyces sp. NPDC001761]